MSKLVYTPFGFGAGAKASLIMVEASPMVMRAFTSSLWRRVPMEMANIAQQRYIAGQNKGWGRLAAGAVARVQEERAGVEIRTESQQGV